MRQRTLKKPFSIDVMPFLGIWILSFPVVCVLITVTSMRIPVSKGGRVIPRWEIVYTPLFSKIKSVHPKTPIYFDCQPDGLTVYPGGRWINRDDVCEKSPSNVVEQLLNNIQSNRSKEYVILLVRPRSHNVFIQMRHLCYSGLFNFDIAADVIDADYKFPQQPDTNQQPSPTR